MKKIYLYIIGLILSGCGEDYFHDSGLANGKHDCTVWEYFKTQPHDWDSTMILIERAGLKSLFDGTDANYKEITFFGITSLSIEQFLVKTTDDNGDMMYNRVADIPVELCQEILLSHVVAQKMMKTGFDHEVKGTLEGGTIVETLSGTRLRVYRTKSDYNEIPDIGSAGLKIHALESGRMASVASADIECTNGVVHSLSYTYEMSEL